jgi:hypothetical protein
LGTLTVVGLALWSHRSFLLVIAGLKSGLRLYRPRRNEY